MLHFTDKKVFNAGADCIVNTINCVGFMGKGLALEFAMRYPRLEEIYKQQCAEKKIHTGYVYFYNIDGQKIINFPTKFHFKYPSNIEWIEQGLNDFRSRYKNWDIRSIAFPVLGSRNGGLNADDVVKVMEEKLSDLDIDVYICKSRLIEGVEKTMVDSFKNLSVDTLAEEITLTQKQKAVLAAHKSDIINFSDINELEGVGKATYKALFNYFYRQALNKENAYKPEVGVQISMFDN